MTSRIRRSRSGRETSYGWAIGTVLTALVGWVGLKPAGLPPAPVPWAWAVALWVTWIAGTVGLWMWRRRRRRRWALKQRALSDLQQLSWDDFERVVGQAFLAQGWRVEETGLGGPDGGVDLRLRRAGRLRLVQVKHWRGRVGAPVVREQYGLLMHHGAERVAIVTLKGFTADGKAFAKGKPIDLIDSDALLALLHGGDARTEQTVALPSLSAAPACPRCRGPMRKRWRRSDGRAFWGCERHPVCRGSVARS